ARADCRASMGRRAIPNALPRAVTRPDQAADGHVIVHPLTGPPAPRRGFIDLESALAIEVVKRHVLLLRRVGQPRDSPRIEPPTCRQARAVRRDKREASVVGALDREAAFV